MLIVPLVRGRLMLSRKRQTGVVSGRCGGQYGFTLVELMVTVVVLSILMGVAIPSMTGLINANRLAGQANELVSALQVARSEAIRQNAGVTVCASTDGLVCSDAGTWTHWLVRGGRDNAVIQSGLINGSVQINAADYPVRFRADGLARSTAGGLAAATITLCIPTTRPALNQRQVALSGGSRIEVVPVNGGGAC